MDGARRRTRARSFGLLLARRFCRLNDDLDAAVVGAPLLRGIVCDGPLRAVASHGTDRVRVALHHDVRGSDSLRERSATLFRAEGSSVDPPLANTTLPERVITVPRASRLPSAASACCYVFSARVR